MNVKQQGARRGRMKAKTEKLRADFWAEVPDGDLWVRGPQVGYSTIPKTMPLVMRIIDSLTKNANAGRTYLGLWCRCFDAPLVEVVSPEDFASEAGFEGERAGYCWRQRMKKLKELGFIDVRKGSHSYQFVLLFNPHKVIKRMKKDIPDHLYRQLLARAHDIGAKDMTEETP